MSKSGIKSDLNKPKKGDKIIKTLLVLFQTDAWLSHSSKILKGIFLTEKKLINSLKKEDWIKLTIEDKNNLKSINQTQSRQINFLIEKIKINTIIN